MYTLGLGIKSRRLVPDYVYTLKLLKYVSLLTMFSSKNVIPEISVVNKLSLCKSGTVTQ